MSTAAWAARRTTVNDAMQKLAQMPRSVTKHGTAVPLPFADRNDIKSKYSNKQINEAIRRAPVVSVPIKSLHAIQHSVKPERVMQYLTDPSLRPPADLHPKAKTPVDHPVVIDHGGKNYLWDGHHRTTARFLLGDKDIEARKVDLP